MRLIGVGGGRSPNPISTPAEAVVLESLVQGQGQGFLPAMPSVNFSTGHSEVMQLLNSILCTESLLTALTAICIHLY